MSSSENDISTPGHHSTLDVTLRPQTWDEYIGQEQIKNTLRILIEAASHRGEPIEHVLFYGPPGLGKTTLAHLIAREMHAQMKITSGPAIERVGDLASLLTNLSPGDVLFIDEIHRMNKLVEEVLYPAMESRTIDIIIGKGPSARTIQLDLPPFTLLAATTRAGLLSSPLRSRFSGGAYRLSFYDASEIERIVRRSARVLNIAIDDDAILLIAERSRKTPRIANQLLKRCRDVATVSGSDRISKDAALKALKLLEIDEQGLNAEDRRLLESLILKFRGGPVGVSTLAAAISEDASTIEELYEPYLLQLGFIERTPRGRLATSHAYAHLGISLPEGQPPLLNS
jgi:holliday junction DNA helicase RuvB